VLYETFSANETDKRRLPMFDLKALLFAVSSGFIVLSDSLSDSPFNACDSRFGVVNCEDVGSGVFALE